MPTGLNLDSIYQASKKAIEVPIHTDDLLGFDLIVAESLIKLSFIDGHSYYYGEPDGRPHQPRTHWYHDQTDPNVFRYTDAKSLAEALESLRKIIDGESEGDIFSIVPEGIPALVSVVHLYRLSPETSPVVVMKYDREI
jgi:hypothetical protein